MSKAKRRKRRALRRALERKYSQHSRYYAAYGSNHNLEQMGYRCPTAETVCRVYLHGWRLVFSGVLTIEPGEEYVVPMSVWKVQPGDIAALDRYEGYPHLYDKMTLDITTPDGEQHQAFTYVLNKPYAEYPPTSTYYRDVEEGYFSWGFDTEVLQKAKEEAVKASPDFPWSYRHSHRVFTYSTDYSSYYDECEYCGSWVPSDELVKTQYNTWVCMDCALHDVADQGYHSNLPVRKADIQWWEEQMREQEDA